VALADLHAFLAHPVRAFLRQRLEVTAPLQAEELKDAIPTDLDGLDRWKVGDRMLAELLRGVDPDSCRQTERQRGMLPPGALGERVLEEVAELAQPLAEQAGRLRQGPPGALDVDVDLGDGRRLTGTVTSIFGNRVVGVGYGRLSPRQRLRGWLDVLALSATCPDRNWTAHTVGRSRAGATLALCGPLDHRAVSWLRQLVDLYDRGMREPLPLPVKTACAYAEATARRRQGDHVDPVREAEKAWRTDPYSGGGEGEDADPAHIRAFGESAPIDVLLAPPRPDELWSDEPHRLGQLAWRLWAPLLLGGERVGPL